MMTDQDLRLGIDTLQAMGAVNNAERLSLCALLWGEIEARAQQPDNADAYPETGYPTPEEQKPPWPGRLSQVISEEFGYMGNAGMSATGAAIVLLRAYAADYGAARASSLTWVQSHFAAGPEGVPGTGAPLSDTARPDLRVLGRMD